MEEKKKGSPKTTHSQHDKDNGSETQYQIVYHSFLKHSKTMLDVSLETGILRANICRYVADMEDKGLIQLLYKIYDKHTKRIAGYYTTNKKLFNQIGNRQFKLFEEGE